MKRIAAGILVAAGAMLFGLAGLTVADPSPEAIRLDPTVAPVPVLPAFHRVLDDATCAKRVAALKTSVNGAPFAGACIFNVVDGSPGAALGLKAQDVICELDGHAILSDASFALARKIQSQQMMKVWSPAASAYRSVQIDAGKLGISTGDYWNLENEYLNSLGKETPDENLLIAVRAAKTDGELAETALARAGLHTPMANLVAAAAAYFDLRFDDCLSFASAAEPGLPDPDKQFAELLAYRSAMATFRWNVAKKIGVNAAVFDKYEKPNARLLPAAITMFRAESPDPMQSPVDAFKSLDSKDQTAAMEGIALNNGDKNASDAAAAELRGSRKITFALPPASFNDCSLGPRGANVDFQAKVHFRATSDTTSPYDNNFRISLKTDDARSEVITLVIFQSDWTAMVSGKNIPTSRVNVGQFCGGDKPFDLHVVAVGGRCEIEINDRPIFYGALPIGETDRLLCVGIMEVGVTGEIDHVSWKTAEARVGL